MTVAVVVAVGCAPDDPLAPDARHPTIANAARVTDVVATDIIPATFPTGGAAWGRAWAINEAGVVAGHRFVVPSATIPAASNVFLWKDGEFTLYPNNINPIALNRKLEMAGNSNLFLLPFDSPFLPATNQALYWKDGVVTELGTLGGTGSVATDINEKGQIVGAARNASSVTRAFIWTDGVMTDLGTLGGPTAFAYGINNHGQVVGSSQTASGATHGFLWEKGSMTDLGVVQGDFSIAMAINNRGDVAGLARVTSACGSVNLPVVWRGGVASVIQLGPPISPCVGPIGVRDISDAGHVLGTFYLSVTKPWVWRDGVQVALSGLSDVGAFKINDSGETAGYSIESVRLGAVRFWSVGRHGPF